jgi:hypothetical protein
MTIVMLDERSDRRHGSVKTPLPKLAHKFRRNVNCKSGGSRKKYNGMRLGGAISDR